MQQALVTGGSGFIGQHLVTALLAHGRRVRVFDLHPPTCAATGLQYIRGSVLDPGSLYAALDGVEEVYHLAGLPGMWTRRKDDFHAVNAQGTAMVIAGARKRGVSRLLHCSTESILFRPSCTTSAVAEDVSVTLDQMPGAYTRSKMLGEQQALQAAGAGFPVVVANPTMPIGPHNGKLTPPTLMLQYFLSRHVQIYLDFIMNLVDVRDVAAGLLLTMERGRTGQRYILGGENIALKKLLAIVGVISSRSALRIPIPAVMAQTAAAVLEFVADHMTHEPPAATVEGVRIASRSQALSIEKAQCELGYAPRPIAAALEEAVQS
ncbi:MAG: NAD-dependent epimerase/dehydratase family protein, partial [Xanthobacteraceae bacterium]